MIAYPSWTDDNPNRRQFVHPESLGWVGPELLFCGHFDTLDCWRFIDADAFVVVYMDDKGCHTTTISGAMAALWLCENTEMDDSCPMRAVIKARRSIRDKVDRVVASLFDSCLEMQHEPHCDRDACRRASEACNNAADLISNLRKGCGL